MNANIPDISITPLANPIWIQDTESHKALQTIDVDTCQIDFKHQHLIVNKHQQCFAIKHNCILLINGFFLQVTFHQQATEAPQDHYTSDPILPEASTSLSEQINLIPTTDNQPNTDNIVALPNKVSL